MPLASLSSLAVTLLLGAGTTFEEVGFSGDSKHIFDELLLYEKELTFFIDIALQNYEGRIPSYAGTKYHDLSFMHFAMTSSQRCGSKLHVPQQFFFAKREREVVRHVES